MPFVSNWQPYSSPGVRVQTSAATTNGVWDSWNDMWYVNAVSLNSGTTCGCNQNVWRIWTSNNTVTAATSNGNSDVWLGWNQIYYDAAGWPHVNSQRIQGAPAVIRQRSEEEERQYRQYLEEQRRKREEEEKARKEASKRAEALLVAHLDSQQKKDYQEKRFFELETIGPDGKRNKYRINKGRSRNVQQIGPDGRVVRTYCAHPGDMVPDEDTMLVQKFMLEACPEEFFKKANVS